MEIFAERLKELRNEKGISIFQLAMDTGFSVAAISRWENKMRVPKIEVLPVLAKYFKVSTDYLLGLED